MTIIHRVRSGRKRIYGVKIIVTRRPVQKKIEEGVILKKIWEEGLLIVVIDCKIVCRGPFGNSKKEGVTRSGNTKRQRAKKKTPKPSAAPPGKTNCAPTANSMIFIPRDRG